MYELAKWVGFPGLLAATLFAAGCSDSLSPERHGPGVPQFATVAPGVALDQQNSSLTTGVPWGDGTYIDAEFNPTNPRLGDAIIVTFIWRGSTNVITTVTDQLANGTPVGNTYTLVEYVTANGNSMATYVATNVQNFPGGSSDPSTILEVHTITTAPVTGDGIMISAYTGVETVSAWALGAHRSEWGVGSSPTAAGPGAIAANAGALVYGVTMSDGVVGQDHPAGFINVTTVSSAWNAADVEYAVQTAAGTVDPQWTWYFNSPLPSTWLATVLALKPAATQLAFAVQPTTTLPGLTIHPPVEVRALDTQGNLATSFNGLVTIAIGHNGGLLLPGTLSGTNTVTAINGVATFSDLSIDQAGNGYTLAVIASQLTGAESAPFNIGVF